jgi:hypothetical protein
MNTPDIAPETQPGSPSRLTFQEELFLFSSLMLATCFFLPWRAYESPSDFLSGTRPEAPFWWFMLIVICAPPLSVRFPRVRPWVGIFTVFWVNGALAVTGSAEWGAQLARLFSLAMLVLSAQPAVISATDFAMKRLNSQKAEVSQSLGHRLAEPSVFGPRVLRES